jgi:sugar O-acyltransferase (sialic acid O-acetyltransferase NeuD family)
VSTEVILFGAGGHAKVVFAALRLMNVCMRVVDDDPVRQGSLFFDLTVEAPPSDWRLWPDLVHVGIGHNNTRRAIAARLQDRGRRLLSVVHPAAVVASQAEVEAGAFIAAGAVVGPGARVGVGVIVNHGAIIDHDCWVGDFAHVAPQSALGGGARLGADVLFGAGAIALPGVEIGDRAIVGAGAVVNRPVAAGQTVIGVPARLRE